MSSRRWFEPKQNFAVVLPDVGGAIVHYLLTQRHVALWFHGRSPRNFWTAAHHWALAVAGVGREGQPVRAKALDGLVVRSDF